mgnify:FL=1
MSLDMGLQYIQKGVSENGNKGYCKTGKSIKLD